MKNNANPREPKRPRRSGARNPPRLDEPRLPTSISSGPPGSRVNHHQNAVNRDQGTMFREARGLNISGGHFLTADVQYIQIPPTARPDLIQGQLDGTPSPSAPRPGERISPTALINQEVRNSETIETQARNAASIIPNDAGITAKRSCDIYYQHIGVQRRGSPLWIPEPSENLPIEYRRQGIAIGDVGILTEFGSFDFLFNICLPRDHPINPPDLPSDFVPMTLLPPDIHRYSEFTIGSYLSSSSVKRAHHGGASPGLTFETLASEGAILIMPLGSKSEDVAVVGRIRKFVAARAKEWYLYANNVREREVKNGDLRVVMGFDQTSAWGMATFCHTSAQEGPCILKFLPTEDRNAGCTHYWDHTGSAQTRFGPDAQQIGLLRGSDPSQEEMHYENQTLFVRTMNITLQDDVWKELFHTTEVNLDVQFNSGPGHIFSSLRGRRDGPQASNAASQRSANSASIAYSNSLNGHPSKIINQMLLKNVPDARMAITVDDDWIALLTKDDALLPTSEVLSGRSMETYDICEEEGIIFLKKGGSGFNANDRVFFWAPTGEVLYAVVKSSSRLPDATQIVVCHLEGDTTGKTITMPAAGLTKVT